MSDCSSNDNSDDNSGGNTDKEFDMEDSSDEECHKSGSSDDSSSGNSSSDESTSSEVSDTYKMVTVSSSRDIGVYTSIEIPDKWVSAISKLLSSDEDFSVANISSTVPWHVEQDSLIIVDLDSLKNRKVCLLIRGVGNIHWPT